MRKMFQLAVLIAVAMMFTLSLSATTLQMSLAGYYSQGADNGTLFSACVGLGCPGAAAIGTISGPELFQIMADVEYDGTNTTYSYMLQDDSGTPVDLTALGIGTPGIVGTSGSPTGWNYVGSAGTWAWLCDPSAASGTCATAATAGGPAVSVFSMTLAGYVAPELQQVAVAYGTGQTLTIVTMPNWQAAGASTPASTPEPASLLLLASGLLSGTYFVRRRK